MQEETHGKGSALATKVAGVQGKGSVFATTAVERRGKFGVFRHEVSGSTRKGSVVATKAVERRKKCGVFATKSVEAQGEVSVSPGEVVDSVLVVHALDVGLVFEPVGYCDRNSRTTVKGGERLRQSAKGSAATALCQCTKSRENDMQSVLRKRRERQIEEQKKLLAH